MAGANIPSGNVFDNLPDVLIDDILMQCSPTDRIRAAAACQALFKVYDQFRKQLTSQSVTIIGSTGEGVLLSPQSVGQLDMKLQMNGCAGYDDAQVYRKLELFVERIRKDGVLHLSNVHALRLDVCLMPRTAQKCMQLLSQLLPNLISIWFEGHGGLELLSRFDLQSAPGICKLGLAVGRDCKSISGLPAFLPRLHTLRIAVFHPMPHSWWQPLSQMSHLRCLSSDLYEDQNNLSGLHQITSLRHLKLETSSAIDMRSISGLQQLESLCLRDVRVSYSETAARLTVTSLTLESVRLYKPQKQLLHGSLQQYQIQGPYWAKLTRVQLAGKVSEQLLQAMLLPHPAAARLNVKLSFEMFDNFDSGLTHAYRTTYIQDVRYYFADTTPMLGPAYFAPARKTLVVVHGAHLHRRMNKSENTKTTDGFAGQNPAGHLNHDVGRGIKTREQNAADHVDHDVGRGIKTREQTAADHVGHDVDRGIKTRVVSRDKPSSRQAITLLCQAGRCCVSAAATTLCLILFFVFWYIFKLFVEQLDATN